MMQQNDAVPIVGPSAGGTAVFGIFEGGGAAGITHVGALKAIEQNNFEFIGVAGASAGALIAALIAVGYKANEIFDTTTHEHLLTPLKLTVEDVLGRADWRRLRWLKKWGIACAIVLGLIGLLIVFPFLVGWGVLITWQAVSSRILAGLAGILVGVIGIFLGVFLLDLSVAMLRRFFPVSVARWLFRWFGFLSSDQAPFFLVGVAPRWLFGWFGLLSSDQICKVANQILRLKLQEHYRTNGLNPNTVPELITFADIDPTVVPQCCTLKIVVTNLASQRLELFDASRPKVVVAEAVTASACFPLAFRPAAIPSCGTKEAKIYADGGLVSNLPIWVFAEEKLKHERSHPNKPPVPILAFSLKDRRDDHGSAPPQSSRGFLKHIKRIVRSSVFGSQEIVQQFISDLKIIRLTSSLSPFDFDCNIQAATETVDLGLKDADIVLLTMNTVSTELAQLYEHSLEAINLSRAARSLPAITHLRLYIVRRLGLNPITTRPSFQVVIGFNMDADTDDRLVMDDKNLSAPQAFIGKGPTFTSRRELKATPRMTKYETALIRRTLQSVIAIPIFDNPRAWHRSATARPEPVAVLCVDSDEDLKLEYDNTACINRIIQESTKLSLYLHALYPKS